ncbi:hypothetical protein EXIGLDRAFT_735713 [Exidia glandulosa HHB12029]|uniref:Secreted protein n=1 Tax=Exidia glandulosa HHB12029 TaxID=1314781 RepID=A0A165PIT4_EXIGL|nr:hypothetical protein EXIGLDRAFT_735713 [Exidia glandulosa HHB12029]
MGKRAPDRLRFLSTVLVWAVFQIASHNLCSMAGMRSRTKASFACRPVQQLCHRSCGLCIRPALCHDNTSEESFG